MEPALQIENLSHSFGDLPVLDDISLRVAPGEFVSIVGPSGCGKSTLLKLVAGLLAPRAGTLRANQDRSVVFQNATLLPWRTTEANVALPLEVAGAGAGEARPRACAALEGVRLEGFEDYYPGALSGGMQQRVALARALVTKPTLLLMDEPFGALDELTREEMNAVLLRARSRQGGASPSAVLFVTHSVPEAVYLSDRVVVLSPRPARVEAVIDIPLPRPRRNKEVRYNDEFNRLVQEVRKSLRL